MYSAGDLKWGETALGTPSGTITWSDEMMDGLQLAPSTSQAAIDVALQAAFQAWEDVAAVDFQQVSSGADVNLFVAPLPGDVAGTALLNFDGNPGLSEITYSEITFASGLTWAPSGGSGSIVDFYAVATHEIGHVLGLDHVNDTSEIMNPVIFADDLGDGDISGAQFLYGTDAGDPPIVDDPQPPSGGGLSVDSSGDGGSGGAFGVLLGLLALLVGIFSGGTAAVAALAAGKVVADEGDDAVDSHEDDHDEHDHHEHDLDPIGEGVMSVEHVLHLPDIGLPMVDCWTGHCEMDDDDDQIGDGLFF